MNLRSLTMLPLAAALLVTPMLAHGENLLDAYHQALSNDPVLAQQLAQTKSTKEGVPLSRAQLLPSLSAGLTFQQTSGSGAYQSASGQVNNAPSTGHSRSRGASLTLNQTILDFSKYANLGAAHAQAHSADALYQAALQNLIVRVTTAYFDVLTAKDQVDFAKANVHSLKRQFNQAQQRFKVGLSAITEVQDAKSSYDSALAQLYVARNSLNDAREALTQITGKPVENLKVLTNELPMQPPSPARLSTWVDHARADNPNILAQQFNVSAADHSITAARDARLPTVNGSVTYRKYGADWSENGPYHSEPSNTTIGLTVSLPLFTGGAMRAQVKRSIDDRDSAQAALTQQQRQVVRNTRNHYRSVISGISQVKAAKQAVISSKSALDATQAGFRVGTQTITQVLIAQGNVLQSQQQYSQARHQLILNKLLLEQDSGSLDVKDLKAVNALLVPPDSPASKMPEANGKHSGKAPPPPGKTSTS